MTWRFNLLHVWILLIAAVLATVISITAWRRRRIPSGLYLALLTTAAAEWTFFGALEAAVVEEQFKILFSQIEYVGFVCSPPFLLLFVLDYTRLIKKITRPLMIALWVIPVLTILGAWTNGLHHLLWPSFEPGAQELNLLVYNHGIMYWIITVYDYAIIMLADGLLIWGFMHISKPNRAQIGAIMVASLFPAIGGVLYSTGLNPVPGLDLVAVSIVMSCAVIAWSVFRLKMLDLVPVAREVLLDQLKDGVVVLDMENRIADLNRAARRHLEEGHRIFVGESIGTALPSGFDLSLLDATSGTLEMTLGGSRPRYFEISISVLYGNPGERVGKLLVLRDNTRRKQAEMELQEANRRLEIQIDEANKLRDQLKEQAIQDSLTGLFNRRYLSETLDRELSRAGREKAQVSILMFDIDHFKLANDRFGHACGDQILQMLGELFRAHTRKEDVACRYGGEEFVLVLPGMNVNYARDKAEELRRLCSGMEFMQAGELIRITVSVGVAVFPLNGRSPDELLRAADRALYRAKAQGRNCTVVEPAIMG